MKGLLPLIVSRFAYRGLFGSLGYYLFIFLVLTVFFESVREMYLETQL